MKVIYLRPLHKPENNSSVQNALVEQISAQHGASLMSFIRVRSRLNENDCEDVLQELYERLLKVEDLSQKLEGRLDTVINYLFQIATNLLIDRNRRAQVRQTDKHLGEEGVARLTHRQSPERALQHNLQLQQIQQALNELKPIHRQAFILNRIEGKSYREVSELLGVSVSTIEKYISSALLAVRTRIEAS